MRTLKYVWKVLSNDGLLKEPEDLGPYYDEHSINGYHDYGYSSKEDAIKALEIILEKFPWGMEEYTLIELYL